MKWSLVKFALVGLVACAVSAGMGSFSSVHGQDDGGGGGGAGPPPGGIRVDADGILRNRQALDPTGQLTRQRANQAMA